MNEPIHNFSGKTIQLNKLGIINDTVPDKYDYFSSKLPNEIVSSIDNYYKGIIKFPISDKLESTRRMDIGAFHTGKPLFAFCKVKCKKDTNAVMIITATGSCKVWVNSKIAAGNYGYCDYVCKLKLNKGDNIFIIEMPETSRSSFAAIRLSSYEEECKNSFVSLCHENYSFQDSKVTVMSNGIDFTDRRNLRILLIPNDTFDVDTDSPIKVSLSECYPKDANARSKELPPVRFYESITYDTNKFEYSNKENFNALYLLFEYKLRSGAVGTAMNWIFLYPFEKETEEYIAKGKAFLEENKSLTEYDKTVIRYCISEMEKSAPNSLSAFGQAHALRVATEKAQTPAHNDAERYRSGGFTSIYHSDIDNTEETVNISIPENYSSAKKYPLILTFSWCRYTGDSVSYRNYKDEDVIFADVTGRGVTMGSYVGEASIWEIIAELKKTYSIDEERIYISGQSNGGAAVWAQLQYHPDKFAGAYIMSGPVNSRRICNVNNIPIINISSKSEHLYNWSYKSIYRQLIKNDLSICRLAEHMNHGDLTYLKCKKSNIDFVLKHKLDRYPDKINFVTDHNRHLSAYWITVHSISFGKKECRIKAETTENKIIISCTNASGFTITLPPKINKKEFEIVINKSTVLKFENYGKEDVHIIKTGHGYISVPDFIPYAANRKGTGISDVYLRPLRIIADLADPICTKVANAFAHPVTNGFDNTIYVDYPIIDSNSYLEDLNRYSLIIIDNGNKNDYIDKIKPYLPIKTSREGFEYKSTKFIGDYCVMQEIVSPYDADKTILCISFNNGKILKKILFTRKVIISSYANGYNPYLNNEALIYADNSYMKIYEWGMETEKII